MGQSPPLFNVFSSFQTNITILTTNKCEKYPSSIWHWDSNSQPSDFESPPFTTRPGLPSFVSRSDKKLGNKKELPSFDCMYQLSWQRNKYHR